MVSATEILSITNAVRQTYQVNPLKPQEQLMKAAEVKAEAMLSTDSWNHNTPTQTPWQFLDQQGYVYVTAGENLAKGYLSAAEVVDGWLDSPSHRNNLLNPIFTETGVAVATGRFQGKDDTTLVVQYLATPFTGTQQTVEEPILFQPPMLAKQVGQMHPVVFLSIFLVFTIVITALIMAIKLRRQRTLQPPNALHWKR